MSHVFISYKHDDAHFVDSLREKLEEAAFETWADDDIEPGEDWKEKIDSAIHGCFAVVVVLTPESHESPYVTYEWSYGMGLAKPIVPILLRNTKIHPKLDGKLFIDFTVRKKPYDTLITRLNRLKLQGVKASPAAQAKRPLEWHPDRLKSLLNSLKSYDQERKKAVALTLGHLQFTDAIDDLSELLYDDDASIRSVAIKALSEMNSMEAVPALISFANRDSIDAAEERKVFLALAQIGGRAAGNFLASKHASEHSDSFMWSDNATVATLVYLSLNGLDSLGSGLNDLALESFSIIISRIDLRAKQLQDSLKAPQPLTQESRIEIINQLSSWTVKLRDLEAYAEKVGQTEKLTSVQNEVQSMTSRLRRRGRTPSPPDSDDIPF